MLPENLALKLLQPAERIPKTFSRLFLSYNFNVTVFCILIVYLFISAGFSTKMHETQYQIHFLTEQSFLSAPSQDTLRKQEMQESVRHGKQGHVVHAVQVEESMHPIRGLKQHRLLRQRLSTIYLYFCLSQTTKNYNELRSLLMPPTTMQLFAPINTKP